MWPVYRDLGTDLLGLKLFGWCWRLASIGPRAFVDGHVAEAISLRRAFGDLSLGGRCQFSPTGGTP